MKKILFLILICIIKLNAYEYLIYNSSENNVKYQFYTDERGYLQIKRVTQSGSSGFPNGISYVYVTLNSIKFNVRDYIDSNQFNSYYRNDLKFLNDLYSSSLFFMPFMNYLYNDKRFSNENYINYDNYELLYNSNGLVVESIVDGKWAGLYSDSERGSSGRLYNSSGVLLYINAEPVNMFQQWLDPLVRSVFGCLMTAFNLIASPVGVVISVVFVMAMLYFVVWLGRKSLGVRDGL